MPEGDRDDLSNFHPPEVPCEVYCIHCGQTFESWQIEFRKGAGPEGLEGAWCCPTPGCDGVGFGFDIMPLDGDGPHGGWVDDGYDDDEDDEEDDEDDDDDDDDFDDEVDLEASDFLSDGESDVNIEPLKESWESKRLLDPGRSDEIKFRPEDSSSEKLDRLFGEDERPFADDDIPF